MLHPLEHLDSHKKVSIWTANQVYIALSHLMTFCPSIGIDSCPVEGFDSYKYNEILNLNNRNLNSTVVAAVGYRSNKDSSQYEKKIRKSNDELFETI
mgnify:FL=1